jgi:hypothetical protein
MVQLIYLNYFLKRICCSLLCYENNRQPISLLLVLQGKNHWLHKKVLLSQMASKQVSAQKQQGQCGLAHDGKFG